MKTEYKRDLTSNYLVIETEGDINAEDYILHMAEQNVIPGLIPFQIRKVNGESNLYYEITSKITVDSVYEKKTMQYEDILRILSEIREIQESIRRYLLNPKQIIFDPCYLYMDGETHALSVCYLPIQDYKEEGSVKVLSEFILKKLDHEDRRAVSLGYSFYQRAAEPNFSLPDTLHEILMDKCREGKASISNQPEKEKMQQDTEETWDHHRSGMTSGRPEYSGQSRKEYEDFSENYERGFQGSDGRKRLSDHLFSRIHPAILMLAILMLAVAAGLFYLGFIDLTAAGGAVFLILAAVSLINRCWLVKRKNQKKRKENWSEENENYREKQEDVKLLQEEMYCREALYDHSHNSGKWEKGTESGKNQTMNEQPNMNDNKKMGMDDTQYLAGEPFGGKLCLINEWSEEYPSIQLGTRPVIVGKIKGQADILLHSAAVSRIHAKLEFAQGRYYIKDLNSKNGTYVNGERLNAQEKKELKEGDKVKFADISYQVIRPAEKTDETRLLL